MLRAALLIAFITFSPVVAGAKRVLANRVIPLVNGFARNKLGSVPVLSRCQPVAAEDERRKADRTKSRKLRRFAVTYVLALTTAMLVASAFVFDLGGMTTGQPQSHRGVVTATGMAGSSHAHSTRMTAVVFGVTFSVPMRD